MLVEHGGHGGEVAAPLAMQITHDYFETVAPGERAAPKLGLLHRRYNPHMPVRTPGVGPGVRTERGSASGPAAQGAP